MVSHILRGVLRCVQTYKATNNDNNSNDANDVMELGASNVFRPGCDP